MFVVGRSSNMIPSLVSEVPCTPVPWKFVICHFKNMASNPLPQHLKLSAL